MSRLTNIESKPPIIDVRTADSPAHSVYSDDTTVATFDKDAALLKYYKPIDTYEGAKRYDPAFEWEAKEEQRLVRTLDTKIMAWCCLTFFALQLDRGNIVQVISHHGSKQYTCIDDAVYRRPPITC